MFFTRLRKHAKWVFVFLALSFGVGYVIFGIGSDQGTGVGDILRNQGGASNGGLSVGDAREQLEKNPKSASAKRALATALTEDGQTDEAAAVLSDYVQQRPKDADALRELAGLHLSRANRFAQQAQEAQIRASYVTFGDTFTSPLKVGTEGQTLPPDPIDAAITTQLSQAVTAAYGRAQTSYQEAQKTYERLAVLVPRDPNVQIELAQAAQQSGDVATAISAFERFLELAPDDPSAPIVKQQIQQLKAAQTPSASG